MIKSKLVITDVKATEETWLSILIKQQLYDSDIYQHIPPICQNINIETLAINMTRIRTKLKSSFRIHMWHGMVYMRMKDGRTIYATCTYVLLFFTCKGYLFQSVVVFVIISEIEENLTTQKLMEQHVE